MWCPNQECVDALESGSPAEFREEITSCPFCGSALVSFMPAWAIEITTSLKWAPVLPVADDSWLPQLKAILDSAGVKYLVQGEGVQHLIGWGTAAFGFNPVTGPPVLMVEESDFERASDLLRDFKELARVGPATEPPAASPPAWQPSTCGKCGKALESSEGDEPLTHCYHCGWPLGSAS